MIDYSLLHTYVKEPRYSEDARQHNIDIRIGVKLIYFNRHTAMKRMIQKTILCLIIITILSPIIRDSQGTTVSKRSAQTMFNAAASCENSLRESKKKQKYRKNWEECIRKFISLNSSVVTNENGLKEKSIFHTAGLYFGLYRYSGKRSDLLKAKELFSTVTTDYPDSELYQLSRTEISRIEEIAKKNGGDERIKDIDVNGRAEARDIRYWSHQKYTRIVLDLDTLVRFDHAASSENRVTLNLYNLYVGKELKDKIESISDSSIKNVQVSETGPDAIAISFWFDGLKKFTAFPLPSPPRIVIDIFSKDTNKKNTLQPTEEPPSKKDKMVSSQPAQKIDTIIIDPGHGGKDPGAIGKSGLTEKEVVLDIGLRLRDMIIRKMGKRVIMTRDTDVFIPLDERSRLANGSNGELFVSIHANSSPKKNTRGVEVYLLGAPSDKRALATAARENSTSEEDVNYLQAILKELAKDFTTEMSLEFAHLTMESFSGILDKRYNIVKLGVKKAPFYVLIHTDMPSILAEVSFISNPYEEALLRKDDYRQKIAEALLEGIREYIENRQGQIPS